MAVSLPNPLTAVAQPVSEGCARAVQLTEDCPKVVGAIRADEVVLDAIKDPPKSTPSSTPKSAAPSPTPTVAVPPPEGAGVVVPPFWDDFVIIEPITLADLASFRPDTGTTHMQPNGWTIAGLPTNFWIDTQPHTLSGLLLDLPATVQFTPVAARFSYGDNTPTVRTPLGSSWTNAGVVEFSPTSTSHTYRTTGTYTITPRVDFTVQYSYDGSEWIPIDGILTATADPLTATVVRASTVLVAGDCTQLPNGPGC